MVRAFAVLFAALAVGAHASPLENFKPAAAALEARFAYYWTRAYENSVCSDASGLGQTFPQNPKDPWIVDEDSQTITNTDGDWLPWNDGCVDFPEGVNWQSVGVSIQLGNITTYCHTGCTDAGASVYHDQGFPQSGTNCAVAPVGCAIGSMKIPQY